VRLALTGAARMPEEAMRRLKERFGLDICEGYGLTEAAPVVTSSAGMPVKYGSVGKVLDGIDVRLVDESGDDVVQGDSGEIWVKGANVFRGYFADPEQTAKVLTPDGWLRTGDIGTVDDDGYLYLVDRAKDLIIVSGFNVFPAEVEEVLAEHPGVAEVGVVGVPHPHHGEAVKAFVVPEAGRVARRGPAHRLVQRSPRPVQVPEQDPLRRRVAPQRERQAAAPLARLRHPPGYTVAA
jgi:long-chain acyl-CoA synthetase